MTPRRADFPTRLYVDRVFTLRGIGTVVDRDALVGGRSPRTTGCDSSRPAARCVSAPSRCTTRAVARAAAGQRVAVSLPGVERRDVRRGDALVAPGAFPRSYRLEVALEELSPIPDGTRLTVHHGTSRIPARVVRVGDEHAQLRLAAPVVAARRRPGRAARRDDGRRRRRARPRAAAPGRRRPRPAARQGRSGVDRPRARRRACQGRGARCARAPRRPRARGGARRGAGRRRLGVLRGVARRDGGSGGGRLRAAPRRRRSIQASHRPSCSRPSRGRRRSSACFRSSGAARRSCSRARPRRSGPAPMRPQRSSASSPRPVSPSRRSTTPSSPASSRTRGASSASGTASPSPPGAYEVARDLVVSECGAAGEITLARFRDLAGVGRRDAQLLLERMDVDGVTRRIGDRRVLRRSARGDGR